MNSRGIVCCFLTWNIILVTDCIRVRSRKDWYAARAECLCEGRRLPTSDNWEPYGVLVWVDEKTYERYPVKEGGVRQGFLCRFMILGNVQTDPTRLVYKDCNTTMPFICVKDDEENDKITVSSVSENQAIVIMSSGSTEISEHQTMVESTDSYYSGGSTEIPERQEMISTTLESKDSYNSVFYLHVVIVSLAVINILSVVISIVWHKRILKEQQRRWKTHTVLKINEDNNSLYATIGTNYRI